MENSILSWLSVILKRDLLIAYRRSSTYITPLVFFLIVVTFFPLAIGPQESLLSSLAPGVIWIAALLASLLAVETIFSEDFRDGTLDDFFISLEPSFILVFAKVLIHWLITGFPILIASSLAAIVLYLPIDSYFPMVLSLILGTSFMSLLGALGAALALGRSAILSAIIVLPFSIPTLQQEGMKKICSQSDVIITTAQVFGRPAPKIITEDMVSAMQPGSVIVDMAVSTGGNVEGSKNDEYVFKEGVTIIGMSNLPGEVARDASQVFGSNLFNMIDEFWDEENKEMNFDLEDEILKGCVITHQGSIVNESVK